ncbi:MAG: hypothetical protein NTW11_01330 [Candidatus Staskawiczbacteria bacterium]|nr:hypothetical protein [Candidatus Staskawiczbacteria bacterium]
MAEKEKPKEICQQCGKTLPILDDKGRPNFRTVGGEGFGAVRKRICRYCPDEPRRMKPVGFGQ